MRAKESAGTPRPYLVQESSEEVRFTREKSNENPTYKEIIIQNKVAFFSLISLCVENIVVMNSPEIGP